MQGSFTYKASWLFKMAWRDSRKNRKKLTLFISSIILGIMALVAINSFKDNMRSAIDNQSKSLLGADIEVESNFPFTDSVKNYVDSLNVPYSTEYRFGSMAYFIGGDDTTGTQSRLVQIKALEGEFPYYGAIETTPSGAGQSFRNKKAAIVDQSLMMQFAIEPGDSIKIGKETFIIEGSIQKVPGRSGISTTVAPPVYIPMQYVEATGLLQKGSRVEYKMYLKTAPEYDANKQEDIMDERFSAESLDVDTADDRRRRINESYENLIGFLNLVAFFALILGCIGVASAVYIYVQEKTDTVALLRCIGLDSRSAFTIYLIQITIMGFIGAFIGTALGTGLQFGLPALLGEFLVIDLELSISWIAVFQGMFVGVAMALLFALLPLLPLLDVSPLKTIRSFGEYSRRKSRPAIITVAVLIIIFIIGFSYIQLQELTEALIFAGSLFVALGILYGIARLLMLLLRKYFPVSGVFPLKQGIANLFRPNNQTAILTITIGLGVALISTLYLIQNVLINEVSFKASGQSQPNMVMFDIQDNQVDDVTNLMESYNLPVISRTPIVSMELASINGQTKKEIQQDTTNDADDWALERDYRVTFRDSLTKAETITKGKWDGKVSGPDDPIKISLEDDFARDLNVSIGDTITFNVQGALMQTIVGSYRKVDFARLQTNFLVLFPAGVLEKAPKFYVFMTRSDNQETLAEFQNAVVKQFPNVSIIDLQMVMNTLKDILGKVAFVIRFMALFSIATGLIVLIGSVMLSRYQRMEESVLLRTLGARKKQILAINAFEYLFLGSIAVLTGIILAVGAAWALTYFQFEAPFQPNIWPLLWIFIAISSLTVIIGMLNSRQVLFRPPLEILRKE